MVINVTDDRSIDRLIIDSSAVFRASSRAAYDVNVKATDACFKVKRMADLMISAKRDGSLKDGEKRRVGRNDL